jgi:peptide/nickel transport system substrate-binding protein
VIGDRTLWDDALETNQAQLLIDVPRSMATQFSGSLDFETVTYGYLSCIYIAMNLRNPIFADPSVRRALLHGYNRERHLASTYQGFGEVLAAPLGTESRFTDRTLAPLEYSDAQASRMLDEAGFVERDDDGIRLHQGQPLSFELLVAQESFNEHQSALKFYQDAMEIIGIDIRLRLVDPNRLRDQVRSGNYDMYWGQWQFIDGISILRVFESGSDDNVFGYVSDEYDAIIANAERAETIHQYSTFIRLAQEHLAREVPVLFLWDLQQIALHAERLKNLRVSAYNIFDYIHEAHME